jgi:hypothetical protein
VRAEECIACHVKAVPKVVSLHHGATLKGWHDVSSFVGDEVDTPEPADPKWLCHRCTRGTLQCGKCKARFDSIKQRCPECSPVDFEPAGSDMLRH